MRIRNRLIPTLVSALALALVTPALSLVAPAPALPEAVAATDTYKVTPGLVFNDPTGSLAKHRRIIDRVEDAIDHAPPGSRIRMAQYLFNLDSTADALVRAYARGVHVQLIIDDYPLSAQTQRMRKVLGTNKKTGKSYVARCVNACMSSSKSVMHAKFFLFSQSGVSKTVSMVSSANPYTGNSSVSWNNMHIMVGDKKLYSSLDKYFNDMLPDKDQPNYYRTTTSGKHKLYFFPRQAVKGTADVPMLDVLNNVRCTGMSKAYGSNGRTVVRIEQWGWSAARLDVARRVWTLHDQGCKVSVIINGFNVGPKVLQVLLRPSRNGQMTVYNAAIDTNGDRRRDKYMHHKVLMVNGRWFSQSKKVVYTGSANLTGTALLANNEIIMRVLDDKTYDAYYSNYNYIRNNWTKRITKAPPIPVAAAKKVAAARVESALESRLATAPDTVNPAQVPVDPAQERTELAPTEPPALKSPAVEVPSVREPALTGPDGGR